MVPCDRYAPADELLHADVAPEPVQGGAHKLNICSVIGPAGVYPVNGCVSMVPNTGLQAARHRGPRERATVILLFEYLDQFFRGNC